MEYLPTFTIQVVKSRSYRSLSIWVFRNRMFSAPRKSLCFWKLFLGGGFKCFLCSPLFGEDSILTHIFQMGWFNHQPVSVSWGFEAKIDWGLSKAQDASFSTNGFVGDEILPGYMWDYFIKPLMCYLINHHKQLSNERF